MALNVAGPIDTETACRNHTYSISKKETVDAAAMAVKLAWPSRDTLLFNESTKTAKEKIDTIEKLALVVVESFEGDAG